MSEERRQRWVEAGIALAQDPTATIPCPVCQAVALRVEDERGPGTVIERFLICPACNAWSAMRMHLDPGTPLHNPRPGTSAAADFAERAADWLQEP